MTPQEIQSALESALATALPTTPTAWPNIAFDPAVDAVDGDGNPVPWIRPTNKPDKADFAVFETDEQSGVFIVQVFAPDDTGAGAANTIANTILNIYRRKTLSGVECTVPYVNTIGPDGNGWYQINVVAPWFAWIDI